MPRRRGRRRAARRACRSRTARPAPSVRTTTADGSRARATWGLLDLRQLLVELARLFDRRAGGEVLELEELPDLDLTLLSRAVGSRRALGPLDRLFPGLHLDEPVAGDQL